MSHTPWKLQAKHGTVLVVVDQPATIGALQMAVTCDAFIIGHAARAMPRTLRSLDLYDTTVAELEMIVGFDDDLAAEATRLSQRHRGLFTQVPRTSNVSWPAMQHPAVLKLLSQFGSPAQTRKGGRRRLIALIRPKAPRTAERLIDDVFTALDEQTVIVPGTTLPR
ncbi:transposase [Streptomyces sp. Ag109_G2-15]|uniref:IS110 family transposase n=1 Tax=Streptomyces sp. Ag109_G2-15 TaxID=1938850 RepID=UPI0026C0DB58